MKINKSDRSRALEKICKDEGCGWHEAISFWLQMTGRKKKIFMLNLKEKSDGTAKDKKN